MDHDRRALRAEVAAATAGHDPEVVAAALIQAVADAGGWLRPERFASPAAGAPAGAVAAALAGPVAERLVLHPAAGPTLLGDLYEAALSPDARSGGAHYTPLDLAAGLVGLVPPVAPSSADAIPRVWDPACGGGVFLLAAAEAWLAAGWPAEAVVGEALWGTDLDPGAVAIADAALSWWGHLHGVDPSVRPHLAVADALLATSDDIHHPLQRAAGGGFDVVIGNPPFQGQMTGSSVRTPAEAGALRARFGGDVVLPYTDAAALFLVAGAESLAPGGRLAIILPTSVLSARDAAASRQQATRHATLSGLWLAGELVFDAAVHVCAVLLTRTDVAAAGPVSRWRGRTFEPVPVPAGSASGHSAWSDGGAERGPDGWARLALPCLGVPDPEVRTDGVLGTLGQARAGFREEYYGLVHHVSEAPEAITALDQLGAGPLAPLITSGLIDPGRCWWGERAVKFARQGYHRPVVDMSSLAATGGRAAVWAGALAVPKVVVATQTRVGEAAVDERGCWVASTPTVAFVAPADRLWHAAAVICSPVGTVAALAYAAGGARTFDAIRHSVASVSALPLPVDVDAWSAGADALRAGDRDAFLAAMASAYAVTHPDELHDWWLTRAPWPE